MRARLAIGSLIALAGCGPSSFNDFRGQLTTLWCQYQVRCGFIGASQAAQCAPPPPSLGVPVLGSVDVPASIGAGRLRFNGDSAQDCLDAVKNAPCDPMQANDDLLRHCHAAVAANVSSTRPCAGSEECMGGVCVEAVAGCGGYCVPFAPPGSSCQPNTGAPGTTCDPTATFCDGTGVCQLQRQAGADCAADVACVFDLVCVDGKCADPPRVAQGDVCSSTTPPCADGLYCDETGTCSPLVARGKPCAKVDACQPGLACIGGACAPWLDAGKSCASGPIASGCPASQACAGGTCVITAPSPADVGQACANDSACALGLFCQFGRCQWQAGDRGACTASDGCAPGLTCDVAKGVCRALSCPNG